MLGRRERLQIAQQAAGILRETGALRRLQEGYTRVDPFQIAIDADLIVMKRALEDLLGGFIRDAQSGILVNVDRPPGMVHMTCAHELGHFFLGHETTVDSGLDYYDQGETKEREANWFAYHLLMPRSLVVDVMRRKSWRASDLKNPRTLYQLSLRLGTSFMATIWTLVGLNLLDMQPREASRYSRTPLQPMKHELAPSATEETLNDVWLLDENDRDRILEPRPNDRFILDLPNHGSAGYFWSIDEVADAGFNLKPITVNAEATPRPEHPVIVGGGERQRYVLEHGIESDSNVVAERLALAFKESQPWRRVDDECANFELSAEFESLACGLDRRSQDRLLAEVAGP